jgi:hypothetical protein
MPHVRSSAVPSTPLWSSSTQPTCLPDGVGPTKPGQLENAIAVVDVALTEEEVSALEAP